MGGIEGIGMGFSGVSAGGYSDAKDTKSGLSRKITSLESELTKLQAAHGKTEDGGKLTGKIQSLEKRIDNLKKRLDKLENPNGGKCRTCEERKYQDGSDDPGVSFKFASNIKPEAAAAAVRGHEMEHVFRNRAEAARQGRKVVSQSVIIHTDICPECGRSYVSGGETRTVTKNKPEANYNVGLEGSPAGSIFDEVA